jgi:hypothetical protein
MTINDIIPTCRKHHTSRARRYVSRKCDGIVETYNGKFGSGYKVYTPAWDSTTYCYVTYYIA